jgi:hypothetical protein
VLDREQQEGEARQPADRQGVHAGDRGRDLGGHAEEEPAEQQAPGCVARAQQGEAEPCPDADDEQVAEGVRTGEDRRGQLLRAVGEHRLEHHQPAHLGGGDGDHERVQQAVTVPTHPVALEGGHGGGQRGVGEQAGHVGVRRRRSVDESDRVRGGQQGGAGREQQAGQRVGGLAAEGDGDEDERDRAACERPERGQHQPTAGTRRDQPMRSPIGVGTCDLKDLTCSGPSPLDQQPAEPESAGYDQAGRPVPGGVRRRPVCPVRHGSSRPGG